MPLQVRPTYILRLVVSREQDMGAFPIDVNTNVPFRRGAAARNDPRWPSNAETGNIYRSRG
jgi:hypothetical protein